MNLGAQDVTPLVSSGLSAAQTELLGGLAPIGSTIEGILPPRRILIKGTVVTMDDEHTVLAKGNVLVAGERIVAVWEGSQAPADIDPTAAKVVDLGADALIYPGLINLHDHPYFAALPTIPPPSSHSQPELGRPSGKEPYANRYQWQHQGPELERLIENSTDAVVWGDGLGLESEVLKHAELRAVLGGQTAHQGAGDNPAVDGLLVRNVGGPNFGRDRVEEQVQSVESPEFAQESIGLRARLVSGKVDAWLVHLAEGVRDGDRRPGDTFSSRHELARIRDLGVLNDATVVLHGTGLEQADFATMRNAPHVGSGEPSGAKLVWSPLSNLLLYGRTTSIYEAIAEGLTVSLGTDWTPTGSNTLLEELKVADISLRDPRVLGQSRPQVGPLSDDSTLDRTIVDMVTRNPARAVRWPEVGSIAPGRVADLLVIRKPQISPTGGMPDSPYRSLIDATERDVSLVLVGGDPVAGDIATIKSLRGSDLEIVKSPAGGFAKAADITNSWLPKGFQTISQVEKKLAVALGALGGDNAAAASGPPPPGTNFTYLRRHLDGGRYLLMDDITFRESILKPRFGMVDDRINLERIELKPLFAVDDHHYFEVLGATGEGSPAGTIQYRPYPSNSNHVTQAGNTLASGNFELRWFMTP